MIVPCEGPAVSAQVLVHWGSDVFVYCEVVLEDCVYTSCMFERKSNDRNSNFLGKSRLASGISSYV